MANFYKVRANRHLKKMMKYMRYILNDHFVLVCLFLLGAFGYYYSDLLTVLPNDHVLGRPIIALIWLVSLFIGRLATLVEEADKVFLLPKESHMPAYLLKALWHSIWLPFVTLFLICGLLMPLVVLFTDRSFSVFFFYVIMLFCVKISQLLLQKHGQYQIEARDIYLGKICWLLSTMAILLVSLYLHPLAGGLAACIQLCVIGSWTVQKEKYLSLDWEKMIHLENERLYRIYRFIHLFTDVPEITSSVKRRKYLDPLLTGITKDNKNTYSYLYARSFLRGSEYSGLFLRLGIVGAVILIFLQEFWLSLVLAVVFLYLIGFQLIPLYSQFDYMVMSQLYPVLDQQKSQALGKLVTILLGIATCLYSICAMIGLASIQNGALIAVVLLIETFVFSKFYVPHRLKKMR